ncbi:MAG: hypothetical protein B7X02_01215, partial [Rhodospirillales bacterium 12-54-5]
FDAKVIAEAVEHAAQQEAYMEMNTDYFQGYHFSAPMRTPPKTL